jgi:20S proteasome alpha/beta subunit
LTLIVAIGCTDGVVIAADSASSDAETGTKQPVEKIVRLGEYPILYAGSGDVGLLQKINENLETLTPKSKLKNTRQEIKKVVVTELNASAQVHAPYPQMGWNVPPPAILLFAGIHDGKPWILEIERDGRDTFYDSNFGNFAAIGSGKPWAEATFRPHLRTERNLELGKIFAYRILDDAINLAAAYLAKPVHIFTISSGGQTAAVSGSECDRLAETCETWRELERETVGTLLTPQGPDDSEDGIPEP